MNYLLLAVMANIPCVALAQQVAKDRLLERLDSVVALDAKPPGKPGRFIGSFSLIYSGGYIIARPAFLYRKLSDVRSGHYAYRVRPDDQLFEARYCPNTQWLRVARDTYFKDSIPNCDTTIYYLRESAIRSKSGAIRKFYLH